MELKGTVLNVVDFGAFVDIGTSRNSGLVHISQLANRYVQEPARRGERGRRGDGVGDGSRSGAEAGVAHDGEAGGRSGSVTGRQEAQRRGGEREGRGPNQGQQGGSGPDRPPGQPGRPLTSPPPVKRPSVAILPEAGEARRPDRDRGGPAGSSGFRAGEPRGHGGGDGGPGGREGAPPRRGPGPGSGPPPGRGGPRGSYPGQGPGRPPRFEPPARTPASRTGRPDHAAAPLVQGRPRGKRPLTHVWPAQAAVGSTGRRFARLDRRAGRSVHPSDWRRPLTTQLDRVARSGRDRRGSWAPPTARRQSGPQHGTEFAVGIRLSTTIGCDRPIFDRFRCLIAISNGPNGDDGDWSPAAWNG